MIRFTFIACLIVFSINSFSNGNKRDRVILQNINYEFITCGVYYKIASEGSRRAKDSRREKLFKDVAGKYFDEAIDLSAKIGMSPEAVLSTSELITKKMGQEMKNDYVNFAVLSNKYLRFCKNLMEKPDSRVEYWQKRVK